MLRPELCGGADGIAIPQGQQGLVASHQGLGQAKPQRCQQRAEHRQVVAIGEITLYNSLRLHQLGQDRQGVVGPRCPLGSRCGCDRDCSALTCRRSTVIENAAGW